MRLSLSSRLFRVLKRRSYTLSAAALSALLLLSSCGGGSGGGGGATAVSGQAIDAPLTGATITVTLNAPEGQTGAQILGTTTADSNGNFTLNISFPNTSAPVFANAQTGSTVLSSYLGPASTLASLSTLSTTNVPNLAISQVTTAALAILAATNQLSSLTPTSYATLLSNDRSDILAVAAGIMAVADKYCSLPGGDRDTFEMGRSMVAGTSAVSSSNTTPTLTNVATTLGNSCSSSLLSSLLQAISASQYWAPELDLGDVVENIAPVVPAGTYHLQGLTTDTGISQNTPSNSGTAAAPSPFDDPSVSVSSSGGITSKDGNVSGQITGNYLTLSLTTGGATTTYSGKTGLLPSGFLSSTTAEGFSLRTGGQDGAGNFVKFDAVLVPQGATPNWTGISGSSEDGTGCSQNTIGFRMHGLGPIVGGYTYNLCATAGTGTTTSPDLEITNGTTPGEDDFTSSSASLSGPLSLDTLTEGTTSYPFILTAASVSLGGGSNGTLDYVMGANEMIYVISSGSYNTAFLMNDNPLDKLAENSQNSDH